MGECQQFGLCWLRVRRGAKARRTHSANCQDCSVPAGARVPDRTLPAGRPPPDARHVCSCSAHHVPHFPLDRAELCPRHGAERPAPTLAHTIPCAARSAGRPRHVFDLNLASSETVRPEQGSGTLAAQPRQRGLLGSVRLETAGLDSRRARSDAQDQPGQECHQWIHEAAQHIQAYELASQDQEEKEEWPLLLQSLQAT